MNKMTLILITAAVFLLAMAVAPSGRAQAKRSFVATTGSDTNTASNCGRTTPCKTFNAAYSVTDAGGEIVALDSGGFGGLSNINKAVTVEAISGQTAFVLVPAGSVGVAINAAANDVVVLRNIQFGGAGGQNTTGVQHNSGKLVVQNCSFSQLTLGLVVTNTKADVIDSTFSGNTTAVKADGTGVDTQAFPFSGPTQLRISGGNITNNGTGFEMANPGSRPCPQGFTCPCPQIPCGQNQLNMDNKVNIFVRLLGNSSADWSLNVAGNTTLVAGSGTGCTNPDPQGGAFCQSVGNYSGNTNPK